MTSYLLDAARGVSRRVTRAVRERSILSFSERFVALRAEADWHAAANTRMMRVHRTVISHYQDNVSTLRDERNRFASALSDIAAIPATLKIANGSTRKAARIAREAMA